MMTSKVISKTICFLGIIGIFLLSNWANAQTNSSGIFNSAYNTILVTFQNARNVVYIVSGFGLIGVATAAIFGKMSFRWLAMICIALATLAGADKIVNYSISNGVDIDESYRGIGEDDFHLDLQFNE